MWTTGKTSVSRLSEFLKDGFVLDMGLHTEEKNKIPVYFN